MTSNSDSEFCCERSSCSLFHFLLLPAQPSVSLSTSNGPSCPVSTPPIISQSFGWTVVPASFNNSDKSLKQSSPSSCGVQCRSPKSREGFPFTTCKTEFSSSCRTIIDTYVMATANHLINFLSLFFSFTKTHLFCLILRLQILGASHLFDRYSYHVHAPPAQVHVVEVIQVGNKWSFTYTEAKMFL